MAWSHWYHVVSRRLVVAKKHKHGRFLQDAQLNVSNFPNFSEHYGHWQPMVHCSVNAMEEEAGMKPLAAECCDYHLLKT